MGSYLSAEKSAARKTGLSVEEWRSRRANGLRHCFRCRSWHRIELFSVDKSRAQGRTASCKACTSLASTASRYRVTVAELKELMQRSSGRCELCRRDTEKLVIDHDHSSGRVRGVLCHACNVALGLFNDNAFLLRKAAEYVEGGRG